MKISYNWLRHYIDLEQTPAEVAEALPLLGFDIEETFSLRPPELDRVVVGKVLDYEPHPNADRLRLCRVDAGEGGEPRSIVCGASNFASGDRVIVALPGAVLPGGVAIKQAKVRGAESQGMICSAHELNMGGDASGIWVLRGEFEPGTPLEEAFCDADTVFDLEITPNRPDCLSHIGIARELAAFYGVELRYPEVVAGTGSERDPEATPILDRVEAEAEEACPHYTAMRIRGVRVGPSPQWLRDALEAIGLRPINNVVDVTNYVLHETGQPLHAFDAAELRGREIVVRRARDGERITTLDEQERALDPSVTVVADAERPLVIAGVMGAADAEVGEGTTDVVLESAWFDPLAVRRAARKLGLSTDSSYRFERTVDPGGVIFASLRAVDLILSVAGGHVDGPMLAAGSAPEILREIELSPDFARKRLGFDVPDERIRDVFEALELTVAVHQKHGEPSWRVTIPSFRGDLDRPVDLVEEFIRVHGTDKIPERRVEARGLSGDDSGVYRFNESVASYLASQGFDEAFAYSLRDVQETGTWHGAANAEALKLANPLSTDQTHLRGSLLPGLLDALHLNRSRGTGATRFFERGRVFREAGGETCEFVSVGFVAQTEANARQWRSREAPDFYAARRWADEIVALAGLSGEAMAYCPLGEAEVWQAGHAAQSGDARNGLEITCGLLDLRLLKRWSIDVPVVAGSALILPERLERPGERPRHGGLSMYPPSTKDLALLADQKVLAETVRGDLAAIAERAKGDFEVERVRVFDVYEGDALPAGKKSLAFELIFRSRDRTLKDTEVAKTFEAIQRDIAEKTDYEVRG